MQLPRYDVQRVKLGSLLELAMHWVFLPLLTPVLELAAFELLGTNPSKLCIPLTFSTGCDDDVTLGANSRIGIPYQVRSCTALLSMGS